MFYYKLTVLRSLKLRKIRKIAIKKGKNRNQAFSFAFKKKTSKCR